jgi:sterol-4alpha-carboxylate 3-dehydrogenase (decarboxylating)
MSIPEKHPLSLSTVLVTGGSGGLASQILQLFSQRGCEHLHSLDLRRPLRQLDGVTYHIGDLTDSDAIRRIFQDVKPEVVIHTASPKFDAPNHIMYKVNVEGTKALIQIAKESGTQSFVYTSSASVISDAKADLKNADETFPVILGDKQPEFYVNTKALAESYVLSQNYRAKDSARHFLTCAIRPSGIFGVGDLVVLPGILNAYFRGQTKVQLGNNRNLFDFTENTNVAHAHYLAAVALARFQKDQPGDDARVDGEAFFITNDEPRNFWDFTRLVWGLAGDTTRRDQVWVITRPWALLVAGLLEWVFWALGLGEPPLTRTKVRLSCMTRYFCIDKAKRRLGYKPLVGLEEGLKQAVEDCVRRRKIEQGTATVGLNDMKLKCQ